MAIGVPSLNLIGSSGSAGISGYKGLELVIFPRNFVLYDIQRGPLLSFSSFAGNPAI
jgi:hypothetical protein